REECSAGSFSAAPEALERGVASIPWAFESCAGCITFAFLLVSGGNVLADRKVRYEDQIEVNPFLGSY
ncbi:MAG TPA: hypothetical protein VIK48_06050, partial [Candidatus Manganitrophaceae bacterium]